MNSKKSYKDINIIRRVETYLDFQNYIELPLSTHSRMVILLKLKKILSLTSENIYSNLNRNITRYIINFRFDSSVIFY